MNNTEYDLLSKEQLYKMLEAAQSTIDELDDKISELESDIACMVWPDDNCGCCL